MPYDENGNWVTDTTNHGGADGRGYISDSDRVIASIPIIGGLSGSQGRIDAANNQRTADENRSYWDTLSPPTADQLTADYQYDPEGHDAQTAALRQLQQWGSGNLTDADRGAMESVRRRDQQGARAQRGALMQQAQARGMGGSGLDFISQQSANQGAEAQASDAEAQMLQGAQARALAAVQAQGQLGGQIRQQGQHETEMRAEAPVQGIQQAYEDQSSRAAGATGQYGTDASSRNAALGRAAHERESAIAGLGSIIASLV